MEIPEDCPTEQDIQEFLMKRALNSQNTDINLLGQGSFGKVYRYKGWVVKMLEIRNPSTRLTYEREANTLDILSNVKGLEGYIVPFCWASENTTGQGFIIQKYINAITLEDFLKKHATINFHFGFRLLQNLIEGIKRLHEAGYIHRDLKPENILVRVGKGHPEDLLSVPILIDFGLACALPCNEKGRVGTPSYFPEEWSSASNLLGRSGARGERYFYRDKAYIRKRERTLKNVKEGHLPAPIKWVNEIKFSRHVDGPGPEWKLLKTQPYALSPEYSQKSDVYSMYKVFKAVFDKINWKGHEGEMAHVYRYMERLRGYKITALAAQYARNEPAFVKARRMEALKRLNTRRNARMENRVGENADAALLANFSEAVRKRHKTRKNGNNTNNSI